MLMNFGPINQRGGEKRLNVIFSRAKHHMALVSSIRHLDITNEYNDGANSLKNFLNYAEAVSRGDGESARRVLENLNPLARKALAPVSRSDAVIAGLAQELRARGHLVDLHVGQSRFRCDLAVRSSSDSFHQLGILVDTDAHYANLNLLDRYLMQPSILRAFGWRFALVLTKDWYHTPDDVLARIEKLLRGQEEPEPQDEEPAEPIISESQEKAATSKPIPTSDSRETRDIKETEPPTVATSPTTSSLVRHFELISGVSRKFWEISISGNAFTVRFGRIGTAGQSQTKTFVDEAKARNEAERLMAEKVKKGYGERA
jgi:predicted DNA-binding WGR domain protein